MYKYSKGIDHKQPGDICVIRTAVPTANQY